MDNAHGLHILQWNCRSLYHKLPEFKSFIMTLNPKPDVLMFQETHLIEKYSPRLPDYEVIRKDRTIHGGGLATFIKNNLNFTQINIEVDPSIEAQFFQISGIKMANIYVPPSTSAVSFQFLSKLNRKSLILGDFNAHHQTWSNSPTTGRGHALARALDDYDMVLLNTEHPTRLNLSSNAIVRESLIDLSIASRDIASQKSCVGVITSPYRHLSAGLQPELEQRLIGTTRKQIGIYSPLSPKNSYPDQQIPKT